MKRILLLIGLSLCLSGCAYFWESVLSAPGPQVVNERTQTKQVGDVTETSTNWWTGDGKSHWCYCSETKGRKVCSGDCR
jgi:hypothetical protein